MMFFKTDRRKRDSGKILLKGLKGKQGLRGTVSIGDKREGPEFGGGSLLPE